MSTQTKNKVRDPLGLEAVRRLIDDALTNPKKLTEAAAAMKQTFRKYTAMKDRYRLLKETSRQLAEEVAWLRDQCDDFMVETELPKENRT
jgi:membrane-bound lytic murein transglycosylase